MALSRVDQEDYLSLTDIARVKNADEPKDVVKNWLRTRNTIEFLGLWEAINNPAFKGVEFDSFKQQAGSNSFTLSPNKWVEATGAIGLRSTAEEKAEVVTNCDHLAKPPSQALLKKQRLRWQ